MLGGKRGGGALISLDDRAQDRRVLFPGAGLPARIHRREQHRGPFSQLLQQIPQNRILSGRGELAVKQLVEIEQLLESSGRDCRAALVQGRLDPLDDFLVLAARREPCVLPFQEGPQLDGLARLLLGHGRDRRAAPRGDLDQAFGSEHTDRLAHGIAGNPEFVGKAAFHQPLARLQPSGQYGLTKLRDHLVVK